MASPDDLHAVLRLIATLEERLSALRASVYRELLTRAATGEHVQLVICEAGTTPVGLLLADVEAVTLICTLAPLAEAPAWVAGLLDYHGVTLPVVDVAARLGAPRQAIAMSNMIVVARAGHRHVGLLVQSVGEVTRGTTATIDDDIHDVPHAPYIAGIARVADRAVPLLSVSQLVAGVVDLESAP